jgi:hypothetical protein
MSYYVDQTFRRGWRGTAPLFLRTHTSLNSVWRAISRRNVYFTEPTMPWSLSLSCGLPDKEFRQGFDCYSCESKLTRQGISPDPGPPPGASITSFFAITLSTSLTDFGRQLLCHQFTNFLNLSSVHQLPQPASFSTISLTCHQLP